MNQTDENTALKMAVVEIQAALRKRNTLITELCDALDGPRFDAIAQRELITRAREATR